jgi:hypothetical protein
MSRRGNGLTAEAYTPLADVPPQLADAMLTAFRDAGIAAYAIPAPGKSGGYLDVQLPGEPTDRLYVDATARDIAESVLDQHLPELRDEYERQSTVARDEEAVWAEIVASFDRPALGEETPWPDEENLDDSVTDTEPERTVVARVVEPVEDHDEEEHFIPPPPPPLPRADPGTKAAWLALIGGPLYLLAAVFIGWEVPNWAAFVAVAAFIGGFLALVLRLGDDRSDGPDDGAVV